jgi:two-component system chemotaxis response regulator CheY
MNILLVDHSKTMRTIQKRALSAMGQPTFAEARDGVEALTVIAAQTAKLDLALIDWNMPNMNGLELITRIRQTDKTTPLIMVTTEAERTQVLAAIQAGVTNYMVKPFTPENLISKVQATLAKAKAA